jgi:hypothetical protein
LIQYVSPTHTPSKLFVMAAEAAVRDGKHVGF